VKRARALSDEEAETGGGQVMRVDGIERGHDEFICSVMYRMRCGTIGLSKVILREGRQPGSGPGRFTRDCAGCAASIRKADTALT